MQSEVIHSPNAHDARKAGHQSKTIASPGTSSSVLPSASAAPGSPTSPASTPVASNGRKIPFAVIVTFEILLCALCVAGTLMALSILTFNKSMNSCLSASEDSQSFLTTRVQFRVIDLVAKQFENIMLQPVSALQETLRLQNQGLVSVTNYDTLWKYFIFQLRSYPAVGLLYYGDESYGDYLGVEVISFTANVDARKYYMDVQDIRGQTGASRCPLSCAPNGVNSSGYYYFNTNVTATSATIVGLSTVEYGYNARSRPWYKQAAAINSSTAVWTSPYLFANGVDMGITASLPLFSNGLLGVLAADLTLNDLGSQLKDITATLSPNAFLFVFSTSGVLLAASNENAYATVKASDNTTRNRIKYTSEFTNPTALLVAQLINQTATTPSDLRTLPSTYSSESQGLLYSFRTATIGTVPTGTLSYVVVAAVPTSDYTAELDATRASILAELGRNNAAMGASAAAVSVFFMLLTVPMTVLWIGRPLRMLCANMAQVAQYDFTGLKQNDRNRRSAIVEVCMIQDAYWHMVQKFAKGIQENRQLMMRGSSVTEVANKTTATIAQG
ncbi:hypothetical protein DFJ73DRAFT_855934 [Zopfochytrium polystomum]|nr:hypothetical protein DFJ73DRAFT_855934 [Zopfochytrium polystomum]